jgi:hypothetical protein
MAEPAPEPVTVNGVTLLGIAFVFLVPMLWVFGVRRRSGAGRSSGCLATVLSLVPLLAGATALAYPGAVLLKLGTADLAGHPEAWVWTAVAPVAALALAWWFGRDFPRPRLAQLAIRTGVLLGACTVAVIVAVRTGIPVFSVQGVGTLIALAATLVCIISWQFIDRLRPAQLFVRAAVLLAAAVGIGALARANGTQILKDPGTATRASVVITLILIAVLIVACSLTGVAIWRLIRGLRPTVAPKPGEIWNADVPFEDDETESKDRPVLVVATAGYRADIMKITSQDKSRFDGYLHLPLDKWHRVLTKESWLDLRTISLPFEDFRSFRGPCRPDVWSEIKNGTLPGIAGANGRKTPEPEVPA